MSLLCSQVKEIKVEIQRKYNANRKSELLHFLVFQLRGRDNTKMKSCGKKKALERYCSTEAAKLTHQCFRKTCEKY